MSISPDAPVATAARAAATWQASMSTRPDPERCGAVKIATRMFTCAKVYHVELYLRDASLKRSRRAAAFVVSVPPPIPCYGESRLGNASEGGDLMRVIRNAIYKKNWRRVYTGGGRRDDTFGHGYWQSRMTLAGGSNPDACSGLKIGVYSTNHFLRFLITRICGTLYPTQRPTSRSISRA